MNLVTKLNVLIVTSTLAATALLSGVASAAGAARYSLSPAGGSYAQNANFSVSVFENSDGEPVNGVQAYIDYSAASLQLVSVSTAGSPFSTCTESGGGNGRVGIACALLGGSTTGNQRIGVITFKVLAASGGASLSVAQISMIASPTSSTSSTDIWNHAAVSAGYSLSPAPKPVVKAAAVAVTPAPAPTSEPVVETPAPQEETKPEVVVATTVDSNQVSGWTYLGLAAIAALAGAAFAFRNQGMAWATTAKNKVLPGAAVAAAAKTSAKKSSTKKTSAAKKKPGTARKR